MSVDDAWEMWLEELTDEERRTFDAKRMSFEAGYERGARAERKRRDQNPMYARPELYARCPGCGANGDVHHVVSCWTEDRERRWRAWMETRQTREREWQAWMAAATEASHRAAHASDFLDEENQREWFELWLASGAP